MRKLLTERMSFRDLYSRTESGRKDRGRTDVNTKPLKVTSIDGHEAWTFSYKSNPSTTGNRWQGYISFFKENVDSKESASDLECQADCQCPDYRYRWAYANNAQDAAPIGNDSLNQCINRPPNITNPEQVPGLCKHLSALRDYLWEKVEPDAPPPTEAPEPTEVPDSTKAPDPDDMDTYSDTRSGGALQENIGHLAERFNALVQTNPQFDVWYEETE